MNKLKQIRFNRRKFARIFGIALILLISIGCANFYWQYRPIKGADVASASTDSRSIDDKIENMLQKMTLEEKVGQLMIVGFDGLVVNQHARSMINKYKVGGIILFDRNMDNPKQVTELINELQDLADQQKYKIPLFMCVDQESGIVVRMKEKVTPAPSQQKLSHKGNENDVKLFAELTGTELALMGFNVDFAPVLDLSDSDSRSYGSDPNRTAQLAKAAVNAYYQAGLFATLKHFPGIGRAKVDLHIDPDTISTDRDLLERTDLEPFKQIIQSVDNQQYFVMVSHLYYINYDPDYPASVSPAIMKDLLRKQLGYSGVVITDDMEMGALTKKYSFSEMGYLALAGGADILLVCHDIEHEAEVYNGVIKAVADGKLSVERIDESVRRVLKMKMSRLTFERKSPLAAAANVRSTRNMETLEQFKK